MIGRFASLACSSSVYITSYYNGISYHYIMVKSENTIVTNLVNELPTTEKNGVEISIVNIKNITKYVEALKCIVFFPNIYVVAPDYIASYINDTKIKHFNNFAVSSKNVNLKLLLGNVLYPIQLGHFDLPTRIFMDKLDDTGVVIKFNIGDLSVTPNRESIIYNNVTIEKINSKIQKAKEELIELLGKHLNKDYSSLVEYINMTTNNLYYNPINDTLSTKCEYSGEIQLSDAFDLFKANITFRGTNFYDNLITIKHSILSMRCINFKGIVYKDKVYTAVKSGTYRFKDMDTFKSDKFIILTSDTRLTAVLKEYLRIRYNKYTILTDFDLRELKLYVTDHLTRVYSRYNNDNPIFDNYDKIINGLYDEIKNKAIYLDVKKDEEFLKFKENLKEQNQIQKIDDKKESILYVYNITKGQYYRNKKTFNSLSSMITYIKEMKCGVILENMLISDSTLIAIAKVRNLNIIKAKKETVEYIRSLNLPCMVNLNYLLTKDKYISRMHTVHKYFPEGITFAAGSTYKFSELCNVINSELIEDFTKLCRDFDNCNSSYIYLAANDNIPIDSYTEYLCLKLQEYITKYEDIVNLLRNSECEKNALLVAAVALKTKAFPINPIIYSKYKTNKLFKVLCKK